MPVPAQRRHFHKPVDCKLAQGCSALSNSIAAVLTHVVLTRDPDSDSKFEQPFFNL